MKKRMVQLKSILVEGSLNRPLKYRLCSVEPTVRFNVWEICVASISFKTKRQSNHVINVSCNYVKSQTLKGNSIEVAPTVLCQVHLKGKSGEIGTIYPSNRDWYEVNSVNEYLEIFLRDFMSQNFLDNDSDLQVHLLLRRSQ